jgi:hypothetical protein
LRFVQPTTVFRSHLLTLDSLPLSLVLCSQLSSCRPYLHVSLSWPPELPCAPDLPVHRLVGAPRPTFDPRRLAGAPHAVVRPACATKLRTNLTWLHARHGLLSSPPRQPRGSPSLTAVFVSASRSLAGTGLSRRRRSAGLRARRLTNIEANSCRPPW